MSFKSEKFFSLLFSALVALLFSSSLLALSTPSIVGKWETIDGKTKKPSSIILIQPEGSLYVGKIVKTFGGTSEKKLDRCVACHGGRKNHPIIGLKLIENMQCLPNYCRGGTILDPRDGKIYKATMRLVNGGQQLKVRGYIGISLFGKTVVWNRYK